METKQEIEEDFIATDAKSVIEHWKKMKEIEKIQEEQQKKKEADEMLEMSKGNTRSG